MTLSPATVSVVIPCYNGAKYLRSTLESALAQTHPAAEILVVDDGSKDDSAAIAESFGPPVRVIRQPNQGESVARNRGIDEATSEWVAFLDADDLWDPEKLAEQLKLAAPDVGAICSGNGAVYLEQPDKVGRQHVPRQDYFRRGWIMEHGAPCHISTLMVRREIPVRFPAWTSFAEDLVYYLDLLGAAKFAIAGRSLLTYRVHAGGQTAKPEMGERRIATLRQWLSANRASLAKGELREVSDAFNKREKYGRIMQALHHRHEGRPLLGLAVYLGVLARSLVSSTSRVIVSDGLRGSAGAIAEALRIKGSPDRVERPPPQQEAALEAPAGAS